MSQALFTKQEDMLSENLNEFSNHKIGCKNFLITLV